jgi:hypothetical protein
MKPTQHRSPSTAGTDFTYYEGPPIPAPEVNFNGDICLHTRLYTYKTDGRIVSGWTMSVMFTIDRLARDVWPCLKDFNAWQNAYGHYYTGVVGDLEGKTFRIGSKPNDTASPYPNLYEVPKVIPEQLIVVNQPSEVGVNCGVRPGFHVFVLNECAEKTIVTVLMDHCSASQGKTEEEALKLWQQEAPEYQRKWRDVFIPTIKKLVYEGQ